MFSFFKPKQPIICPYCFREISRKDTKCPYSDCAEKLPHEYTKYPAFLITIVGPKGSGKSNYIAVLVERMYKLEAQFDWTFMAANDATAERYNRVFRDTLYSQRNVIDQTFGGGGDDDAGKPLTYFLSLAHGNRFATHTFSFFDTAGEDMQEGGAAMRRYAPHIFNANGIIWLFDPLQQVKLRNQLEKNRREELDKHFRIDPRNAAGDVAESFVNGLLETRLFSQDSTIDIPLAVVFSKMDEFRKVFGEDAPVHCSPQHNGHFNKVAFGAISDFVNGWVCDSLDARFMNAIKRFKKVGFFSVSSFGQQPVVKVREDGTYTKTLDDALVPERVEDPLLWFFWQQRIIKEK